ncbi:MAG TPA: PQQ-binding-like beta-propeller repeat protein [Candidatus Hydrogenedentes bacterium]|nr:PQQ-binding-like beta-propeller repeat protein [Candidatus Hydrogenedentota bacterium]
MKVHAVLCLFAACCGTAFAQTTEWQVDLGAPAEAPTLLPSASNPTGLVIAAGDELLRLDGRGNVVWRLKQHAALGTPATVASLDGDGAPEILAATIDGEVLCLEESGELRWRFATGSPLGGFECLVAADVIDEPGVEVVFGFNDGWLNCLNAKGELMWRFFGDAFRVGGIAAGDVDADGAAELVYGTDNGHLYCLSGWGEVEWRYAERAPYGRSGPNIADLDGNGRAEVLITRSNVGNATCLIAVDGPTGNLLWRTSDLMQGYISNAIVNFSNNNRYQVIHADKGNHVYCENPDGSRRWMVELDGRGIFWAPAAADIDGDSYIEVVTGIRGQARESGACLFVLGQDGTVDGALNLGSDANAGPAIGDIDGDGDLEVVVAAGGPARIQAISWNQGGRVAWPSLRGDSAMTGTAANVPAGAPVTKPEPIRTPRAPASLLWGENEFRHPLPEPAQDGWFVEVSVQPESGPRQTRIRDLREGAREALLTVETQHGGPHGVKALLHQKPGENPTVLLAASMDTLPPDMCGMGEVTAACAEAEAAAQRVGADVSGLRTLYDTLDARTRAVAAAAEQGKPPHEIAGMAAELRKQARFLQRSAKVLTDLRNEGDTGVFVFWRDPNPWDPFDPFEVETDLAMREPITIHAFANEFEDAALTLLNTTAGALTVRCTFQKPSLGQQRPQPAPDLAAHVTLRRPVPIATTMNEQVYDALPQLDRSQTLTLQPGSATQLWLVVDTHGLEPGAHELTLYLGSLTRPASIREIPLRIEVWPVALPGDVFVKMNWSGMDAGSVSEQVVQDMLDHGVSCIYGPSLPAVPVDASGNLSGDIDWSHVDATLARVPKHFFMLWGGPPARRWPEGINPSENSDAYFAGFKTAIDVLANHLLEKGHPRERWAFYPIDEPWNTGFGEIPRLKAFCEMVKRADPQAQVYTDPAGLVRAEYLAEFKDLIDIWQPEVNILKRDPALVTWFQENAKHFWTYNAMGPGRDLLPLGHYRALGWSAWDLGVEGLGYWVYRTMDIWWPVEGGDYDAVYQNGEEVVPSRRWEADRDGVEDYRALHVLSSEISAARQAGRGAAADEAQRLLDEAVDAIVGWHMENIDEITIWTREYDIELELFQTYRAKIAAMIQRLRETK